MKKKTISIIIIILLVLLAGAAWYEVPVTEHIKVDGKGKITSPVRLALVTDLHSCYYGKNQEQLIKMIDDAKVDAVLLSGDIVDDKFAQDNARIFIEGICDRYPCYYVTGNHEFWGNRQDEVKEYLRSLNVSALDGAYATLEVRGNTIVIAGVDDPTYMTMDEWTQQFKQAECGDEYRDNYKILLSHRPEKGDVYAQYDYDLVLCGHAHGGQWKIPFTQMGVHAPDQGQFPKYVDGLYKLSNGTDMVVSRGLCRERMPYPRYFNHPEVVIIDLE